MIKLLNNLIICIGMGCLLPALAIAADSATAVDAAPKYLYALSYDDAEGAIGFALSDKGAGNKISANITGHKADALFSYDKPITVEIRGLQYDKTASRWNASLMFVNEGTVISAMPVAGRFEEVAEIPVLKRSVKNGDVIQASDVEVRDFAVSRTRSDTVTDIASLIGKSPAHSISPARPIREQELESPAIIKKNGLVQIRYAAPGMEITASGQALEEGAKGTVINVRNLASKRLVRAVIADDKTVNVLSSGAQTAEVTGASYATN